MSTFDQPGWSFDQSGATFDGANGKPLWLSIASTPPLHLYRDTSALPFIPAGERAARGVPVAPAAPGQSAPQSTINAPIMAA